MKFKSAGFLIFIAIQPLLLSSCATKAVWARNDFYAPAPKPNLQLFLAQQRDDVLVQYDELRERKLTVQRRAYFLYQNFDRDQAQRKPRFVSAVTNGLSVIPIFESAAATNVNPTVELFAISDTNSPIFVIYSRDQEIGSHHLPVYPDYGQRAGKILLTPFAAVADVTLVSAVVGFVAWMESGFPPFSEQTRRR